MSSKESVVEFKFAPKKKFEYVREVKDLDGDVVSKQLIGEYHPGMTYNCTKDARHDALREKCRQWEAEGLITIMPLKAGQFFKTVKVGQ